MFLTQRTNRVSCHVVILVIMCGTLSTNNATYADLFSPLGPDEVLLFADDGTGFNPFTLAFNNWSFTPAGDWTVGIPTNAVSLFPNYQGTSAADEMNLALGPNNDLIIADVFDLGFSSMTSPVFSGTTPAGVNVPQLFLVQDALMDLNGLVRGTFLFDSFKMTAEDITIPQGNGIPGVRIKLWSSMHLIYETQSVTGALLDHTDALNELRGAGITDLPFVATHTVNFVNLPDMDVFFDIPVSTVGSIGPEWISVMSVTNIPEPSTAGLLALSAIVVGISRRKRVSGGRSTSPLGLPRMAQG